jgi:glucose 1-dehydrogenase
MGILDGRKALVTGASSGIGEATAIRLGAEGASVCVNYFSDKEAEAAAAVVAKIDPSGTKAFAQKANVGSEPDVIAMVQAVVTKFGGVDILVNNAGIEKEIPTLDMALDQWNAVINTNLTGAFLCLRECGKVMVPAKRGVIVNMSTANPDCGTRVGGGWGSGSRRGPRCDCHSHQRLRPRRC